MEVLLVQPPEEPPNGHRGKEVVQGSEGFLMKESLLSLITSDAAEPNDRPVQRGPIVLVVRVEQK